MQSTPNYGLYLEDNDTTKFKEWREKMAGITDSNMIRIDKAVKAAYDLAKSKADAKHTHTASDVGALASNGNAVSATKATQDSKGQQIDTTYIKALSVSGKTITYIKGDDSTGTITTQDTNTTYSAATPSTSGLMSAADKKKLDGIASGAQVNPTSLKNPNALTIQLNGTSQEAYDGSAEKTVSITPKGIGAVPTARKVNGKTLSADITLTAEDVGALASDGTAAAATKLVTAREFRTNLASTASKFFDGTTNIYPGVTGILPITSGGTGAETAAAALTKLGAVPKKNPVFTGSISFGRVEGSTVGSNSVALGRNVEASGDYSYAEGNGPVAEGISSHAEGVDTVASGASSHAEGDASDASGYAAHSEGYSTIASGGCAHAEGDSTTAEGDLSHAEGDGTTASNYAAHAEGDSTIASGYAAHAEGEGTTAEGYVSHAEGESTAASNYAAHAEGDSTIASNYAAHAGGKSNKAMTDGGTYTNSVGDVMILGNGTGDNARSNCFRVTYLGEVYGLSAFNSTGADYAEFFEWADGNPNAEDRVGYFVTLEGKHIRPAKPGDYILGIISGQPCIIGNADEDWLGRWVHDDFGRFVLEYLEDEKTEIPIEGLSEEEIDALRRKPGVEEKDGKLYRITAKVVDHETPSWRHKANPNYDPSQAYVERKDRPEWSAVGMLGVLSVRDDGTCQVNGFCRVTEGGTATAADAEFVIDNGKILKGYRVLERISDSVIRIVFR